MNLWEDRTTNTGIYTGAQASIHCVMIGDSSTVQGRHGIQLFQLAGYQSEKRCIMIKTHGNGVEIYLTKLRLTYGIASVLARLIFSSTLPALPFGPFLIRSFAQ